jgi:hypothetical protein
MADSLWIVALLDWESKQCSALRKYARVWLAMVGDSQAT